MATDWRKDFWTANETDLEHAERVEAAERTASWYFDKASASQLQHYRDTLSVISAYRGAPKWERMRDAANAKFAETTAEARALFDRSCISLMSTGEISDELDAEWTAMFALQAVRNEMESAA